MLRFIACAGLGLAAASCATSSSNAPIAAPAGSTVIAITSQDEWEAYAAKASGLTVESGVVAGSGTFKSRLIQFNGPTSLGEIVFRQSPDWNDWTPAPGGKTVPRGLGDAPVLITVADGDYWILGRRQGPGGRGPRLGGYHAWHSTDMKTWTHHGPVTDRRARWVSTAEYVDGAFYIYYDYPNDQDPHLMIDHDLSDGELGRDVGMVFDDPTHGSDAGALRDRDGRVHLFYEDYSANDPSKQSWDAPLGGLATSADGIAPFSFVRHAVDTRTRPTGRTATYRHPHWKQHPDWDTNIGEYEVHTPKQDAFGDWTAILVGDDYYLFADYDPADALHIKDGKRGTHMKTARFTTKNLDEEFTFVGAFGQGHPDPTVGFAAGQFHLLTQAETDFVSDGPWVKGVTARAGVDSDGDGAIDQWTDWSTVEETYTRAPGFSRVVDTTPAALDLSGLPLAYGVTFEFTQTKSATGFTPEMDALEIVLTQTPAG